MSEFLKGIAIGGYRGIGAVQEIGPFDRFNFFSGANNSGKSTVLDFLFLQFGSDPDQRSFSLAFDQTKQHVGSTSRMPQFEVLVNAETLLKDLSDKTFQANIEVVQAFKAVTNGLTGSKHDLWFRFSSTTGLFQYFQDISNEEAIPLASSGQWYKVWSFLTKQADGGIEKHWIPETLKILDGQFKFQPPKCHLLPAVRQVGPSGEAFEGLDGQGLIDHLQLLQNPPFDQQEKKTSFEAINRLVQTVLRKKDARIEIPHDKENIIVHLDGKSLPLREFGTGIEEVILIGAYCTIYDGSLMCLEEPEIHLHPVLQRQLLEYLKTETSSQYFISTHSAALLDMPDGRVFSVRNDGENTTITTLQTRAAKRLLTDELGYRASDIVQSNAVIWVEGPSDRLYLLTWIKQHDAGLIEGIHFSIMFYGGRLLSNLSGDVELQDDFINLKALNQNSAILIDSDKESASRTPNAAKKRIKTEFEAANGFAWITKGREIENYLDPVLLETAMREVHPQKFGEPLGLGDFDNRLVFTHAKTGESGTCDKVAVAQKMCEQPLGLDFLDLEKKVQELVTFIRSANGM